MHPDPHPALDPALDLYPWSGFVARYKLVLAQQPEDLHPTDHHHPILIECADADSAEAAWNRLLQDTWLGTLEIWHRNPTWTLVRGVDRFTTADGKRATITYQLPASASNATAS